MSFINFEGIYIDGKPIYVPQRKQQLCHNVILNRDKLGLRDFLFGGAARGGKSYLGRFHLHYEHLKHPKLKTLIVRESFQQLKKSHFSEIEFDLPKSVGKFNRSDYIFYYTNGGQMFFGYGGKKANWNQYLSAGFDVIFIDELTTLPFEFSYKLRSRLTSNVEGFTPYWMNASNPGGIGAKDAAKYFIKKSVDLEKYDRYNPKEICFIPFTVLDNTILLERDPDVLKRLQQLPEKDRQKYLEGNWDAFDGQFFDEFREDIHVIKKDKYLRYDEIKRFTCCAGMDYGNHSYVYWMYRDVEGRIIVFDEWYMIPTGSKIPTRPEKIASLRKFIYDRGLQDIPIYGDTNMWLPDGFDKQKSSTPAREFRDAGINLIKVAKKSTDFRGYRKNTNDLIRSLLHWEEDKNREITLYPKLYFYERCHVLREQLPALVTSEKDPEDIEDNQEDHSYDAMKMGVTSIGKTIIQKPESREEQMFRMLKRHNGEQVDEISFMSV